MGLEGTIYDGPLVGRRSGKLTVVARIPDELGRYGFYMAKCDCGGSREVKGRYFRKGHYKGCGCVAHGRKPKDYTGCRFGRLLVLRRSEDRRYHWVCQCDCGKVNVVCGSDLVSGHTYSCGCLSREKHRIDMTGKKFGHLVVLRPGERHLYWLCRCDCGKEKEIRGGNLRSGVTRSCGCRMGQVDKKKGGELWTLKQC